MTVRVDLAALRERALRGPGQLLRVEATTVVALVEAVEAARVFEVGLSEWCDGVARDRLRAALAPFTKASDAA